MMIEGYPKGDCAVAAATDRKAPKKGVKRFVILIFVLGVEPLRHDFVVPPPLSGEAFSSPSQRLHRDLI